MLKVHWIIFSFVLILFLNFDSCCFVSASCVDINTASLEELQNLIGIGPAYSERIIEYREDSKFEDLDELINIKGIGDITLEKIKAQDLAGVDCSSEEEYEEDESLEEEIVEEKFEEFDEKSLKKEETKSVINLNSYVVGEQNLEKDLERVVYESKNEKIRKYAIYFFAGFLVLVIGVLLFWR